MELDRGSRSKEAIRLTRRNMLRLSALAGCSALVPDLARWGWPGHSVNSQGSLGSLPEEIAAVMQRPRYAGATWNLLVTDVQTGEAVYELNADRLAFTGSVRKLFSVGVALRELGADHRFTTPVYRLGTVDSQGTLHGDLVLVAGADLTLGGRLIDNDHLEFTEFDHNDANSLQTAILGRTDPLSGLESLARQVREAGIQSVDGDVVIDDRLFESFRVPNQNLLVTPIMVNENMVDVSVVPTQPGQAASVDWRPRVGAFTVRPGVTTVAAGAEETVTLSGNGLAECIGTEGCEGTVGGNIPVGYRAPLSGDAIWVRTFRMEEPAAFARTAFVEALGRAGVTVSASAVGANPVARLPLGGAYAVDTRVAQLVSPPYSEFAKLVLKVSLNLGANLSLLHFGLARGQRTLFGALQAEREALVNELGLHAADFDFPTNGSGSPDSQATPRAVVQVLREMSMTSTADVFRAALPTLGVDGSLTHSGTRLPARGHVFAKTGTTVADGVLKAQNLAGYIDAMSGRQLAFALYVNDAGPIQAIEDVSEVFEDEARITNAIYELN
jgi:PBP4 family serine-type D-alanyl-D-alanine carboxypeptidase